MSLVGEEEMILMLMLLKYWQIDVINSLREEEKEDTEMLARQVGGSVETASW